MLGLTTTVSLEPDPIPLDVKVVLFGDRLLYFLLAAFDPELGGALQGARRFRERARAHAENEAVLRAPGRRRWCSASGLKPLDRDAVARVLEHARALADHAGKLSLMVDQLRELLIEADFCAGEAKRERRSRATT